MLADGLHLSNFKGSGMMAYANGSTQGQPYYRTPYQDNQKNLKSHQLQGHGNSISLDDEDAPPLPPATLLTPTKTPTLGKQTPPQKQKEPKPSGMVLLGSALGTLLPMILLANKQNTWEKALNIPEHVDVRKLLRIPHDKKIPFLPESLNFKFLRFLGVDYGMPEILGLGASSVAGGFLGGVIGDKGKDTKEKAKEGTFQFITNILAPVLACHVIKEGVEHAMVKGPLSEAKQTVEELRGKETHKLEKFIPEKLNGFGKAIETNLFTKAGAATVISMLGIGVGVGAGAFISNAVNKLIDPEREKRKIKGRDFLIQGDDMIAGFTVTGALKGIPILRDIDKVLPLIYFVSGNETGKQRKENPNDTPTA
jgi:hypothetical protein